MNWNWLIRLTQYLRIDIFFKNWIFIKFTSGCIPNRFNNLLIIHFFKNSITAKYNKIKAWFYLKTLYIWCWNNTFRISSVSWIFSFNISDSSRYWKSSWENSMRSNDHLKTSWIFRRWIGYVTFILINLSSIWFNSSGLFFIFWFMIMG